MKIIRETCGLAGCHSRFSCIFACPRQIKITKLICGLKMATLTGRLHRRNTGFGSIKANWSALSGCSLFFNNGTRGFSHNGWRRYSSGGPHDAILI